MEFLVLDSLERRSFYLPMTGSCCQSDKCRHADGNSLWEGRERLGAVVCRQLSQMKRSLFGEKRSMWMSVLTVSGSVMTRQFPIPTLVPEPV